MLTGLTLPQEQRPSQVELRKRRVPRYPEPFPEHLPWVTLWAGLPWPSVELGDRCSVLLAGEWLHFPPPPARSDASAGAAGHWGPRKLWAGRREVLDRGS